MNQEQLRIMSGKKGFIAALDQSGGSTPKALKNYGIREDQYSNDEDDVYNDSRPDESAHHWLP